MLSTREQVLSALFDRLQLIVGGTVKRNEALPQTVPAGGLVILRDGEPGEPDVTLNPRTEFYNHRAEIEVFVTQPAAGGSEVVLDALLSTIGSVLASDTTLGGLAENPRLQRARRGGGRHRGRSTDPERASDGDDRLPRQRSAGRRLILHDRRRTMPKVLRPWRRRDAEGLPQVSYGIAPPPPHRSLDFKTIDLSSEQPIADNPLLGRGRNAQDPYRGLISDEGAVEIPLDLRGTGFWLTGLFGDPTTTQTKAAGHVAFVGQPVANGGIVLNGVTWTFVGGTPSGSQTQIGASLDATLTALAADLNASADAQIAKCIYTANTDLDRLEVQFDTATARPPRRR